MCHISNLINEALYFYILEFDAPQNMEIDGTSLTSTFLHCFGFSTMRAVPNLTISKTRVPFLWLRTYSLRYAAILTVASL